MSITVQLGGCGPILCAHLLRKVDEELIGLLHSLGREDWDAQTISPLWKVRDVAAHLLDTALRKLSMVRDSHFVEQTHIRSEQDLIDLVNRLNREGVTVYRRLSPALLIEMMKMACDQSAAFHESLDPFARATFAVTWAGEEISLNWFDTARELTERWHHQQQIRLATRRPGIMTRELYYPVLDCFARGLPHALDHTTVPAGTRVLFEISGDCGGMWVLSRGDEAWSFASHFPENMACKVTVPEAIAWRLFTKGIDRDSARANIQIHGDQRLAEGVLSLTAIVG